MDIKLEVLALFEFTQAMRRDLHKHPELSFEEIRTAGIVAKELETLGYLVRTGVGRTGVIGTLEGTKPTPVVMLRFDMDALPIVEANDVDYASINEGVMHACGHDSHVAAGLTIARILAANRDILNGTVKFVFQPAEEVGGGAIAMINDGALEAPVPDFALSMHVWNERPLGWYAITEGPVMAGSDKLCFTIHGKGGHGAVPHLTADPIVTTAHIITALQTIISRNVSPLENAVVSVTHVEGGSASNIIPAKVDAEGTIRTFLPEIRQTVHKRLSEIIHGIAEAMNCSAELDIITGTKSVINDPAVARKVAQLVRIHLPEANVETDFRTMGSEDMSEFLNRVPGCFVLVGSANDEKKLNYTHHNPRFDIDESCLPEAITILTEAVFELLNNGVK